MGAEPWLRTVWSEAVWASDLRPLERLVALAYADHARDSDRAWLTLDRLMERTGLSRDAANRARLGLVEAGWLVLLGERNRRKADVYRLVIPARASSPGGGPLSSPGDGPLGSASSPRPDASSPPDGPLSSPSPDMSSPPDGLNHRTNHRTGPQDREPKNPPNPRERGNRRPSCQAHRRWRGDCADCRHALDPPTPRPPWCGDCDEQTRHVLDDNDQASNVRCPDCHPLAALHRRSA